jgi:hypothetical protein
MAHAVNADIQMHHHNDSYSGTKEVLFLETHRHLAGLPFFYRMSLERRWPCLFLARVETLLLFFVELRQGCQDRPDLLWLTGIRGPWRPVLSGPVANKFATLESCGFVTFSSQLATTKQNHRCQLSVPIVLANTEVQLDTIQ